ncbi:MAG: primosomal protein N', partial [Bacteroidales bacterium]|nr:primosomal protein N' [Bacteroidales bacterium]
ITDEEIRDPYKPKVESYVSLTPEYANNEQAFNQLLDQLGASKRTSGQCDMLLAFLMHARSGKGVGDLKAQMRKADLLKLQAASPSRLQSLVEKGVFQIKEQKISRLAQYDPNDSAASITLSAPQQKAYDEIKEQMTQHEVVLLHGVTGSGKTEIYIKMIDEVLKEGKQVLYLLPEIALTSQIVNRLRKYFGDKVGVYHSRFNEYERVEIWNQVLQNGSVTGKYQLILGARSALFLPYQNLGLVIVDEEHDGSYKQVDPAPRYHARDGAIVLAGIHKAKTLLGTATPSLETYYNVKREKYGLVQLMQRYANSTLPEIWVVNLVECIKQKQMHGQFSEYLLEHIEKALNNKEQVIIFQNRRGYSLRLFCNSCQSMPTCRYCDVTLTYHKRSHLLKCHYCGYAIDLPTECPSCHSKDIEMQGYGTEQVEEILAERFPNAVISRMDLDTTRSKSSYQKIITDFEEHKTDILVGTQMVTKGLDFDRVSVVGILNADSLISYPDFRSFERAYQLMEQVSGRAGRKEIPGKVIIQSYRPEHPALQYVVGHNYEAMYQHQIEERKNFFYPPISKMIKVTLKHRDEKMVSEAAAVLADMLRQAFPKQVLGPEFPLVSRVQNYYMKDCWVKFARDRQVEKKKAYLRQVIDTFQTALKYKSVRVVINVDC